MSDTQSVEMPLGRLRNGYTFREEGKEQQRAIISIIARHASATPEEISETIARTLQKDLSDEPLLSRRKELQDGLGIQSHALNRSQLEDGITSRQAAIQQAVADRQLDKIDLSLSLLRELASLMQAREAGAPYDVKQLKALSRKCSTHSREEATENIAGLERLRSLNNSPAFQKEVAYSEGQIAKLTAELAKCDEEENLKWCTQYDRRIAALEELRHVDSLIKDTKAGEHSGTPRNPGNLLSPANYSDFKVDLASYLLKNSRLALYDLRDSSGDLAARICDGGRYYAGLDQGLSDTHRLWIAIDAPDTGITVRSLQQGIAISASDGSSFESQNLDLVASARSELEEKFRPTFVPAPSRSAVTTTAEKHEISVRMNPGGVLNVSECSPRTKAELFAEGSGIIVVGPPTENQHGFPVYIKGTVHGEAPLCISLPPQVIPSDLVVASESSFELSFHAGNAHFVLRKSSVEGVPTSIDLELQTPRGRKVVAFIRDGKCVLSK
jgi:hypothetical protein